MENRIIIELERKTRSDKKEEKVKKATQPKKTDEEKEAEKREKKLIKMKEAKAAYLSRSTKKLLLKTGSELYDAAIWYTGTVRDDVVMQQRLQNAKSVATRVTNTVSSVAKGAAAGGWVGAAIALAACSISEVISGFERNVEWNMHQQENIITSSRSSDRLGIVASSGNRHYKL